MTQLLTIPEGLNREPPTSFDEMVLAMLNCEQTPGQSVYQHGMSVCDHLFTLRDYLKHGSVLEGEWKLPDWLEHYKDRILANLHEDDKIQLYALYHDCGKPYCRHIDEQTGQVHFPNHEQVSRYIWSCVGGDDLVGHLIANDMVIHTASSQEIAEKMQGEWSREDCVTLLMASLAEITSNAKMFGGVGSLSFRIKWKVVDKRGRQILKSCFPSATEE